MAQDFWRHSGFRLLSREAAGRLLLNDDFLRACLLQPELRPLAGLFHREPKTSQRDGVVMLANLPLAA